MATTIAEIRELLKELVITQKDTETRFKETDLKFKETAERFKETDKRIQQAFDLFEGQWGKLIESLVEGDLVNLLQKQGIRITRTSTRVKGNYQGREYEFDIIAHDGSEIVVVEVKTTLRVKHVKQFVEQLRHVRTWMSEYKDFKVYGAIAFLRAEENSDRFAQNERLFVIRATGDSAIIINGEDFEPRVF